MAGLSRVPGPRSPLNPGMAVVGVVLVVVILALAIEPWGSADPDRADPTGRATLPTDRPAIAVRADLGQAYRPEAFAATPPAPDWEIRTPARSQRVQSVGVTESGVIASGPVVDLGPADTLGPVLVNHPADARLEAVRLWRFGGDQPERLELVSLRSPWPVQHVAAYGLRVPGAPAGRIGTWREGLYRLDLLVGPPERIRILMLSVGPSAGSGPAAEADPPVVDRGADDIQRFSERVLRRLPTAATLWTFGTILTGWARPSDEPDCRVVDLWRTQDPRSPCWPVPIGPTHALGVNLPSGQRVEGIVLTAVDPLPGPVALTARIGVDGHPGLAALRTPAEGLPDGLYRLTVALEGGGQQHWYLEVGPEGRQVEAINAFVTGARR